MKDSVLNMAGSEVNARPSDDHMKNQVLQPTEKNLPFKIVGLRIAHGIARYLAKDKDDESDAQRIAMLKDMLAPYKIKWNVVKEMAEKINERAKKRVQPTPKTIEERFIERIRDVILSLRLPYRRASSQWVGGRHTISVQVTEDEVKAEGQSYKVYQRNRTWPGRDSNWTFFVKRNWLSLKTKNRIFYKGLFVLDQREDGSIVVVTQGKGFCLNTKVIKNPKDEFFSDTNK